MDIKNIKDYLLRTLGIDFVANESTIPSVLFFIRKQFNLFTATIADKDLCFLLSKKTSFSQHQFQDIISSTAFFYKNTNFIPVFVFSAITKQQRLELVKLKISFIVPDSQMFMPFMALDFSDRIPQKEIETPRVLRPASQALIIQQLLTGELEGLTINQASKVMKYTAMGVLRAADQLNYLKICEVKYNGFSKTLHFSFTPSKLWGIAKNFLRNPVKKIVTVEDDSALKDYPLAGEFVLAKYSDLSVTRKTYAIEQSTLTKLLKEGKIHIAYSKETGCAEVQVWSYTLPTWQKEVDLFSLTLSFKDTDDARIKIALLNLEEQYKW